MVPKLECILDEGSGFPRIHLEFPEALDLFTHSWDELHQPETTSSGSKIEPLRGPAVSEKHDKNHELTNFHKLLPDISLQRIWGENQPVGASELAGTCFSRFGRADVATTAVQVISHPIHFVRFVGREQSVLAIRELLDQPPNTS